MTHTIVRLALACMLALAIPAGAAVAAAPTTGIDVGGLSLELPLPPGYCALSREHTADRTALDRQTQRYAPTGVKLLLMGAPCAKLTAWRAGGPAITEWAYWLNQTANNVPTEYRGPRDVFLRRTESGMDSALGKQAAERKANTAPLPAVHSIVVDSQKLKRTEDGVYMMRRQRTVPPDGKAFETVFVLGHTLVAERAVRFEIEARLDAKLNAESLLKQAEPVINKALALNAKRQPVRGLTGKEREEFTGTVAGRCRGDGQPAPPRDNMTAEQRAAMCRCIADTTADRVNISDLAAETPNAGLSARLQAVIREVGLECAIALRPPAAR